MLEKPIGGRGILLGGVPGVAAATVMIIGGGVVGMNAAFIAIGMEADVFVFDKSIDRLRGLDIALGGRALDGLLVDALDRGDAAARGPGDRRRARARRARAASRDQREQLELMKRGAVLVDVSIDQGGCFETSRPTTHSDPTYEVDGVLHYCVANMPGAVPITSTYALTNATLPYVLELAEHGVRRRVDARPGPAPGRQRGRRPRHASRRRRERRTASRSAGRGARRSALPPHDHRTLTTTHRRRRHDGDRRHRHRDPELHRRRAARSAPTARTSRSSTRPPASRSRPRRCRARRTWTPPCRRRSAPSRSGRRRRRASARWRCCGSPTRSRRTPTSSSQLESLERRQADRGDARGDAGPRRQPALLRGRRAHRSRDSRRASTCAATRR